MSTDADLVEMRALLDEAVTKEGKATRRRLALEAAVASMEREREPASQPGLFDRKETT